MTIKTPKGKVVAYTIGKSVLKIVAGQATVVGRDYSVTLANPEDQADAITIAVENGEFILENIEDGGEKNAKTNKEKSGKDESDGAGEGNENKDKGKSEGDGGDNSKSEEGEGEEANGKSEEEGGEGGGEGGEGEGKDDGGGDGGENSSGDSSEGGRKYTAKQS